MPRGLFSSRNLSLSLNSRNAVSFLPLDSSGGLSALQECLKSRRPEHPTKSSPECSIPGESARRSSSFESPLWLCQGPRLAMPRLQLDRRLLPCFLHWRRNRFPRTRLPAAALTLAGSELVSKILAATACLQSSDTLESMVVEQDDGNFQTLLDRGNNILTKHHISCHLQPERRPPCWDRPS